MKESNTIEVSKDQWDKLLASIDEQKARAEAAEDRAAAETRLREALTKELGRMQQRNAKLLVLAGKHQEIELLEARLKYLLTSEIVKLYDEVDPETGKPRFHMAGLDACFMYAFDKTFGG